MNTLLIYLWKEWRDHRTILIALVVAIPLLVALAAVSMPSALLTDAPFADLTALASLLIVVVSVCTDLVPGEARRGHLRFLSRVPGGLGAAFIAKALFFVVAVFGITALGWFSGAVAMATWPAVDALPCALLAVFVAWAFALSCGLPRGVLAVPAAVLLFALLIAPFAPWLEHLDPAVFGWDGVYWWIAGAFVAAALAFIKGRAYGGAAWRALGWCAAVAVVCATPYWADAAAEVHEYENGEANRIAMTYLGDDGRYLFVNLYRDRKGWRRGRGSIVIDTRDGSTRHRDKDDIYFGWSSNHGRSHRWLLKQGGRVVDARTAACTGAHGMTEEFRREWARSGPTWTLADGRKAWVAYPEIVCDDGTVLAKLPSSFQRCGAGVASSRNYYFEFTRLRAYRRRDLDLAGRNVWIRRSAWLVEKQKKWELLDPDAKTFEPASGLGDDHVIAVLDDDRVLVQGEELRIVDPETGAAVVVPVRGKAGSWSFGGSDLLIVNDGDWFQVARLDGERLRLSARVPMTGFWLVGSHGDDAYAVVRERRIVRLRLDGSPGETIFELE